MQDAEWDEEQQALPSNPQTDPSKLLRILQTLSTFQIRDALKLEPLFVALDQIRDGEESALTDLIQFVKGSTEGKDTLQDLDWTEATECLPLVRSASFRLCGILSPDDYLGFLWKVMTRELLAIRTDEGTVARGVSLG